MTSTTIDTQHWDNNRLNSLYLTGSSSNNLENGEWHMHCTKTIYYLSTWNSKTYSYRLKGCRCNGIYSFVFNAFLLFLPRPCESQINWGQPFAWHSNLGLVWHLEMIPKEGLLSLVRSRCNDTSPESIKHDDNWPRLKMSQLEWLLPKRELKAIYIYSSHTLYSLHLRPFVCVGNWNQSRFLSCIELFGNTSWTI